MCSPGGSLRCCQCQISWLRCRIDCVHWGYPHQEQGQRALQRAFWSLAKITWSCWHINPSCMLCSGGLIFMQGATELCVTQDETPKRFTTLWDSFFHPSSSPSPGSGTASTVCQMSGEAGLSHLSAHRLEIEQAHTTPTQACITQSNKNICTFQDDSDDF